MCFYLDVTNFGFGLGLAINRWEHFWPARADLHDLHELPPPVFLNQGLKFCDLVSAFCYLVIFLWNRLSKGNNQLFKTFIIMHLIYIGISWTKKAHQRWSLICFTASKSNSYSSKDHFIICKTMKMKILLWHMQLQPHPTRCKEHNGTRF